MTRRRSLTTLTLALLISGLVGASAPPAAAQLWNKARNAAKRAAEREAAKRADEAVTEAFAIADDAVRCAVHDRRCIKKGEAAGKQVVYVDSRGNPLPVEQQHASSGGPSGQSPGTSRRGDSDSSGAVPGEGIWANYDFVPGERVLFLHDFESTRTGNFPSRLEYIAGNLDVVELGEEKVLRVGEGTGEGGGGGSGCFTIPLPEVLPERYTIELRVQTSDPLRRASLILFSGADETPDQRCTYPPNPHVYFKKDDRGLQLPGGHGAGTSGVNRPFTPNEWFDVRIAVDGPYWKMYVNEERVANVPRYEFERASSLHVFLNTYRRSIFVDDIRIAEGGPRSLYDDLEAAGFVSTTAIRFDSGSARLRPESTAILADLLDMMEKHPELQVLVEGHTDSQGSEDSNRQLSQARAKAVAAWLETRGVVGSRLATAGLGESDPVASNSSAEGRAQNRRVVIRKR